MIRPVRARLRTGAPPPGDPFRPSPGQGNGAPVLSRARPGAPAPRSAADAPVTAVAAGPDAPVRRTNEPARTTFPVGGIRVPHQRAPHRVRPEEPR
ncbi:hypothetical protein ACIBCM_34025 [Streptomyces sp. NPDC051018]|uniref:hypothetical protein n=1 Tax=Streptomyces sp. NPDC051018 TaxID=3365639 RepID=UPI0037B52350